MFFYLLALTVVAAALGEKQCRHFFIDDYNDCDYDARPSGYGYNREYHTCVRYDYCAGQGAEPIVFGTLDECKQACNGMGHKECPQTVLQNTSTACRIDDWTEYYMYRKDTGECVKRKACEPPRDGKHIFTTERECLGACYDMVNDPCVFAHYAKFHACPYGYDVWRYSYNKTSGRCVGFLASACYDPSINLFYDEKACQRQCKKK
ncbi:hypothetical protein V5799_027394 [Amblyomma americanum]|uniref:BPTI/Kunitz inhibitor domain-containing protein n=1 Tax=Amblyomma americanum TaxID=6943 RepID=A0AAQ4DFU8_AMBAM